MGLAVATCSLGGDGLVRHGSLVSSRGFVVKQIHSGFHLAKD